MCLCLHVAGVSRSIIAAIAGFYVCFVLFVFGLACVQRGGGEMSRSIIAAVANFMFVCVVCVCACMLQVCPALSLRPMPALCYVLFAFLCVCLSLRVCSWGWEMSRSIIAAIADFMLCFVCVLFVCI